MKKGLLLLTLAVMLLSALPVIALAANETDMSTVVTYTKNAPSTPESEPPPATYEINIPSEIRLNPGYGTKIEITSNYMNLNDGQTVCVTLDERTFAEDGYFYLKNSDNEKIEIILMRMDASLSNQTSVSSGSVVARFDNSGTVPVDYGVLMASLTWENVVSISPGEYTGTIYFKIGIENN